MSLLYCVSNEKIRGISGAHLFRYQTFPRRGKVEFHWHGMASLSFPSRTTLKFLKRPRSARSWKDTPASAFLSKQTLKYVPPFFSPPVLSYFREYSSRSFTLEGHDRISKWIKEIGDVSEVVFNCFTLEKRRRKMERKRPSDILIEFLLLGNCFEHFLTIFSCC